MRAKQLIAYSAVNALFGQYENHLIDAIALLEEAIRLDPKFTLAYCACAEANASLCFRYDWTSPRRASADEAVKQALRLQPELPEVHLAYARHLYGVDRDYEKAKGELAIARRGLPNDVRVILAGPGLIGDRVGGRKPSADSVKPLVSIRAILLRSCIWEVRLLTYVGFRMSKRLTIGRLTLTLIFNRLGELRDRTYENQQHRASGLNLVVAAIALWNTVYLERAISALQERSYVFDQQLLVHLSPLKWEHINLTGDYHWRRDGGLRNRKLRPLRSQPLPDFAS